MRGRGLAVALLVVLAGCSAGGPLDDGSSTGGGPTVDPDNPWGSRTLAVSVEAPPDDDRAYRPLVRGALDYWERNAEQYAGYPVSFRLVDDAADADVAVEFVPEVTGCDDVEEAAGCAPYITDAGQISRPERIEVLTGLRNASTVLVLQHEFGHLLGLTHGDDPQAVMAATENLSTLPKPNATERTVPWRDSTVSVYVDYSNVSADRETVREQVRHAVEYYDDGADGRVPTNVSFEFTDNRSAADVVVGFPSSPPCGGERGSCGYRYGSDPDGDGAAEWYSQVDIAVVGIDAEAVGWHVGYWLGYGFGFTDPDDWPAVFRNASASERRSEWWTGSASPAGVRLPVVASPA